MTLLTTAPQCARFTEPCPRQPAEVPPAPASLLLGVLAACQFLMVLDVSIVNVALPAIQADLGLDDSAVQYVASLYAMAFGGLLVVGGRVADRYGRRRVLVGAMVAFAVASAGTGLATTAEMLFVGRVVLGVAAAFVSPAALSLTLTIFDEPASRRRALSVWGAVAAVGGVAGLLAGGLLTDALGWRWVFYVDIAPALAVAILAQRLLPESRIRAAPTVPLASALLLSLSVALFVIATTAGGSNGWTEPGAITAFALATVATTVFAVAERRSRRPLVDWALLRAPTIGGANLSAAILSALIVAQGVFVSVHLQRTAGYDAIDTALALMPLTALAACASVFAGRFIVALGLRSATIASFVSTAIGFALLIPLDDGTSLLGDLLVPFVFLGVGIGTGFVAFTVGATDGVDDERRGVASGIVSTSQQLGAALGLGVLSAVSVGDANFAASFALGTALALVGAAVAAVTIRRPLPASP